MRSVSLTLTALALLALPGSGSAQEPPPILFRNVLVFDGERMLPRTDVLVSNGRIERMAPGLSAPAGARVEDGAGATLLPGLIDAHTHVFGEALSEALIFGVTTELDMFSDAGAARALREQQRQNRADDRADLFSAGTLVTAPGGHGTQFGLSIPVITEVDSAQAFVDARIAEGSDWIKIVYDDGHTFDLAWNTVSRELLHALITAAHRRGKLAVVHVSTARAAREAVEAGADGLVHLFTDAAAEPGFAELTRQRGAFVVPTLVVLKSITGEGGSAPLVDDARLRPYLPPTTRAMLTQAFPSRGDAAVRFQHALTTTRELHRAGVPVLAGSDAPNPGTAHGVALHRELELLVEAGLPPLAALTAATAAPAAAFGLADRGRIAEGMRADLLLVDGDPSVDITATRAIRGVWKRGVPVDRAAYAAMTRAADAAGAGAAEGAAHGMIADFETGAAVAAFGTAWLPTTDAMAGGASVVSFAVEPAGAGGSAHALAITGTISDATESGWAGVMWSPGAQPMQPGDLSARQTLHFATRGDGRNYSVVVFSASRGMVPLMRPFTAPAEWTEVSMKWSDFGIDGSDVMAVMFVGTPPAGAFRFMIDDVQLR